MRRSTPRVLAALCLAATPATQALIVFDSASSTNNTFSVIVPGNATTYPSGTSSGAPWQYAAAYGNTNASGVYIGNGFVLTARHTGTVNGPITINGTAYSRDQSFAPVPLILPPSHGNAVVDLQLLKVQGDPGLAPLPMLGTGSTADLNSSTVLFGVGAGKGAIIAGEGWAWGNATTWALRWGANTTASGAYAIGYPFGNITFSYQGLAVFFNSTAGKREATGAIGDSGGPLFRKIGTTWTLVGANAAVSGLNSSRYDRDTVSPGDQNPDASFFVRLATYSWVFRYDHWKTRHGLAASTGDASDDDGDGVPLLLEYMLGMDPTASAIDRLPVATAEGGQLHVTFGRLATVTDATLTFQTAATPAGPWDDAAPTLAVLDASSVFQTVRASFPIPEGGALCVKLRASRLD